MKRNNKKGFTIVELVIVIAVIAILSAVLIPTFGTLISDANRTAAQQEARNEYTEYLITNPTADVDYIFINNSEGEDYWFDVNGFERLTTAPTTGNYLEVVDGTATYKTLPTT